MNVKILLFYIISSMFFFRCYALNPKSNSGIFIDVYFEISKDVFLDTNSVLNNSTHSLNKVFFEYFVENAMNRTPIFPIYTEQTITFNKLIIPKQNSGNITSEIENYGMELVREFTKRNYFNSIDYHVESNEILKIYIK
jgi:hypothetical protein